MVSPTPSTALVSVIIVTAASAILYLLPIKLTRPVVDQDPTSCEYDDDAQRADSSLFEVGLAHVTVPRQASPQWGGDLCSDQTRNDVVLEMAIQEIADVLYIYVDGGPDKHSLLSYASKVYNLAWDLACFHDKPELEIIVVSTGDSESWDELFRMPDLEAVYGKEISLMAKRLGRDGLLPVSFRFPEMALAEARIPGQLYLDNGGADRFGVRDTVIVNGTFDHLHHGHKRLLAAAITMCTKTLVVGILASPILLGGKAHAHLIESLDHRKKNVFAFAHSLNAAIDIVFVDVHDEWGPAATWEDGSSLTIISTSDSKQAKTAHAFSSVAIQVLVIRRTDRCTLSSSRIREHLLTS